MAALRADKIVFIVGFIGTLLLFAATLHSAVKEEDKEVNCWTPGQFTEAHVEYTNHICEYEEHRHYGPLNSSGKQPDATSEIRTVSACSLAYYGIQAVLLFISYYILSSITSTLLPTRSKSPDSISKESLVSDVGFLERTSCSAMLSYLFTQLLCSVILIGLGMRSLAQFPSIHPEPGKNHTFLCEFEIQRLGQTSRYTVQCVEDEEEFGGAISMLTKGAPYINTMLCMVLVIMITVHVVTMLCCGSRARALQIGGAGGKQALGFDINHSAGCISDATLAAALAREISN